LSQFRGMGRINKQSKLLFILTTKRCNYFLTGK
jgi:hypothetical protein